jgi:large subunit ribosomal protein L9
MRVILLERIQTLGQMGEEVTVKPGFARNFLLPRKKALRANEANREFFQKQKAQLEAENLNLKADAEKVAAKITNLSVTLLRQAGEAGQLYGSVSARDIADAVCQSGCTINRTQASIAQPIKIIGVYPINVVLHPEVTVSVLVNVARSDDEAVAQAESIKAGRPLGAMPPVTEDTEKAERAAKAEARAEREAAKRAKKAAKDAEGETSEDAAATPEAAA